MLGGITMNCERCNVEMQKHILEEHFCIGRGHYAFEDTYGGRPIEVKSVYICPQCGKFEFNVKK